MKQEFPYAKIYVYRKNITEGKTLAVEMQNEKKSIIILDNNQDFRKMAADMLTMKGFNIAASTSDPGEALRLIEKLMPDVVLFDVVLSKIDGIAFLKAAVENNLNKRTKYITSSTIANETIIKKIMQLGASYYLIKPIDFDILAERIHQVCESRQPDEPTMIKPNFPDVVIPNMFDDLESQVTSVILEVGIPAHVKGYHYVRAAIILAVKTPESINAVTKIIYPTIAKQYKTSSSRVERAIRHAIEVAWDRGNVETLNNIFGYSVNSNRGKPTNSEFIAMIADRIRIKNRSSITYKTPAYK